MKLVLLMSLLPGIILKDDCCTSIPEGSFSTTSGATDTPTGSASETEMDSQSETGVEPVPLDRAVVFVTRSWLRGDEALEAEVACAQEAATAGLSGNFIPWLALDGKSAASRLTPAKTVILPNGLIVSADWQALLDGELLFGIWAHVDGGDSADKPVWTGTQQGGTIGQTCEDWSVLSLTGTYGVAGKTTAGWTDSGTADCRTRMRVYCFQQS